MHLKKVQPVMVGPPNLGVTVYKCLQPRKDHIRTTPGLLNN
jgi:hypothetical protein